MSGEYGAACERALEHYESAANRDSFQGDRNEYLSRALGHAQVLATLAVAEALEGLSDLFALVLDGERSVLVRQAGRWAK